MLRNATKKSTNSRVFHRAFSHKTKIAAKILLIAGILALTACVEENNTEDYSPVLEQNLNTEGATPVIPPKPESNIQNWQAPEDLHNPDNLPVLEGPLAYRLQEPTVMLQLTPLTPGEELATLHTNMGDITLRFFPSEAPIAVTNFLAHARNGYYDGLIFHRVMENFMIQGGCPNGTGTGGQSVWGGNFDTERSFNLRHFRGALAMAHAGPGTIGSQFYIVQNHQLDSGFVEEVNGILSHMDDPIGILPDGTHVYLRDFHPQEGLEYFLENGGTPHLDWFWNRQGAPHPVFGHVVEGMDVVDAIANTAHAGTRPIEDVIIERISFRIHE